LATSFRESDAPAIDADKFPSLKAIESLLEQLKDPPLTSTDNPYATAVERYSSAEPLSSGADNNDSSDDDDEAQSESESLFGDHEFMDRKMTIRNDVTALARVCHFPFHCITIFKTDYPICRCTSARSQTTQFPKLDDL
jgi:hypothetical protein